MNPNLFGGRYKKFKINGLHVGRLISIHIDSISSVSKLKRLLYGIVFRIKTNTPHPFLLYLSLLSKLKFGIHNSFLFVLDVKNVSTIPKISQAFFRLNIYFNWSNLGRIC